MAEKVNQNVFITEKFITLDTLSYFWGKTKTHVDGLVSPISSDVAKLKTAVGDATSGLVKEVDDIRADLEGLSGGAGSISTQINNAIAELDVTDAAVEGQYVSSVSETDGKITVTRVDLPDYTEVYDAKGAAAAAENNAKAYADGLASNYDAAGTAAGLDAIMSARVAALEAIDHNQIAADAAATAVAGVIDGAPEAFDTLKEVAAWIGNNDHASDVATLMTDVENLKGIDHNAYVAADETTLASAKSYADGLAVNYDAAGAAATAKSEAIADAEAKYQLKGNYEAAGTAEAKIAALDLANTYEAKGAADTALADAKTYVDGKVDGKFDALGSADAAQAAAIAQAKADAAETLKAYYTKTEVDNLLSTNSAADQAYAKQYTDELFNSIVFAQNSDIDAMFTTNA